MMHYHTEIDISRRVDRRRQLRQERRVAESWTVALGLALVAVVVACLGLTSCESQAMPCGTVPHLKTPVVAVPPAATGLAIPPANPSAGPIQPGVRCASAAPGIDIFLAAIRQVESGGRSNPPDGDGGAAIGPYQIHREYWQDSRVPGRWQDCRDRLYAERVVLAYLGRYQSDALGELSPGKPLSLVAAERLARTHNGGPSGPGRASTLAYWAKVRAALEANP
jgi:hypothetical protein